MHRLPRSSNTLSSISGGNSPRLSSAADRSAALDDPDTASSPRDGHIGGFSVSAISEDHRAGDPRWLLVTDVDDTLLGDAAAFAKFVAATSPVAQLTVVLNSARPVGSLHRTMNELSTDWRPFGVIGALGTEIELNGVWLQSWRRRFGGFDRRPIDALMARIGCEPHDEEFQTSFKASFVVPPELQATAESLVRKTGVPAKIIRSGETNFDVIAEKAGKGAALLYVREALDIPPERTLAAGDSYNDLEMLLASRGIVVGNATPKLKAALHHTDAYLAEQTHAAGVLEGLEHLDVPLLH